jgi:hypothetical protein
VAKLLYDRNLAADIDQARGFLERQELTLVPGEPGVKLFELACTVRPELLLVSDRGWEPWSYLDEVRSDPEFRNLRVLFVASHPLPPERREALAGASITIVDRPSGPAELANAVAAVMNIPTRVTLRTKVVFEVTTRTEADEVVGGRMLDVSTGGFLLESDRSFENGASLYCFFSFGQNCPVIFATARVVHGRLVTPGRWEHGLEFIDIRLDDRRRIAEFVFRQSGLQAMIV